MQVLYAVSQSHNGDVRMAGQGLISLEHDTWGQHLTPLTHTPVCHPTG